MSEQPPASREGVTDWLTIAVLLMYFVAISVFKRDPLWVLLGGGIAGLLVRLLFL